VVILQIRAELRKIATRPLVLLLTAVMTVASLVTARTAQAFAQVQWDAAAHSLSFARSGAPCAGRTGSVLQRCLTDQAYMVRDAHQLVEASRAIAQGAGLGQHSVGAFGWAAGLFGSIPGLFAAFLLAAVLVAGEWERGTMTRVLLAEPRMGRVLRAKATAVWITLVAAVLVAGAVTALFDVVYARSAYPNPDFYPTLAQSVAFCARRLCGAAAALALCTAAGVLLAARLRTRATTLAAGAALALALNLSLGSAAVWQWLPGGVFADVMQFHDARGVWDHLWSASVPGTAPLLLRAVPTLLLLLVIGLGVRRWKDTRDPIG
jgi:hypothetical protein